MKIDLIHNKLFYLILLGVMFLIPKDVFAYTITSDLGKPSVFGFYESIDRIHYASTYTGTDLEGLVYQNRHSGTEWINGMVLKNDTTYLTGGFFKYNNINLCDGSSAIIKGKIALYGGSEMIKHAYVTMNDPHTNSPKICPSAASGNYLYYDCPFNSIVNRTIQFGFLGFDFSSIIDYRKVLNFGFDSNVTIECEIGNDEVISNQERLQKELEERLNKKIDESTNSINSNIDEMKEKQQQTNDKLDEIQNTDISDEDKTMPDDSSYKDYSSTQDELLDKTKEADLDSLDVGLDVNSSSWVWDTLTSLIQSHSVVFGMVIAILSIGVIKLVLGR